MENDIVLSVENKKNKRNTEIPGLPEKLLMLQNEKGWTQQQAADSLGVNLQTWRKWTVADSKNRYCAPSADMLVRICNVFGCDSDFLLGRLESKKHVMADLKELTGLSEKAVMGFLALTKNYPSQDGRRCLQFLLENPLLMDKLLMDIQAYLQPEYRYPVYSVPDPDAPDCVQCHNVDNIGLCKDPQKPYENRPLALTPERLRVLASMTILQDIGTIQRLYDEHND